jgi:hypothetical protein
MMKKFIFTAAIFGAGLLALAFAADYVISKNLRESALTNIFHGNLKNDVVIMGNSRAYVQISPLILDSILGVNSYNLGFDGTAINGQIIKYDAYRKFNARPKVIIQNIDFWTLGITVRTNISEYQDYADPSIGEKYIPAYKYFGKTYLILIALGVINDKVESLPVKGFYGFAKSWDGSELAQQTEIAYSQDSLALSLFDSYLAKARSEDIRVVFVYAPLYIGATRIINNIEGMYQMYDTIARKYNIPILDYTYDSLSYDTTYFYNATHLNRQGAELFSVKLAHDLDSLGLIK